MLVKWNDAMRELAIAMYSSELRRIGEIRFWVELERIKKEIHDKIDGINE